ncbi:MAG TPA: sugar ABC transporter ATP-binding protein [Phycisphaerae bacterium]|nr:sugar ABC transporter ATP-binding protein [Phycisphaerae bacterium]
MSDPYLQVAGISKAFGGVQALVDVSLDVRAGEVHALCGENGAGKSTLIKILGGSCLPDHGHVRVGGQALPPGSVLASEAAGIAVIHQEAVAFPDLNAVDNIFVGRELRRAGGLWLDRRRMRLEAAALLARLGEEFDLRTPAGDLPLARRQMVAIARALLQDCRLLILDEPTSSLSSRETQALFRIIRQLKDKGVSTIYVSHRLEEVFELADRVTVLRDGRKVATRSVGEISRAELIRLMVGRDVGGIAARPKSPPEGRPIMLEIQGLTRAGVFEKVSFSVHAGEVVGMAGLVGAGRSDVAQAIFGVDRWDEGRVLVAGKALSPGDIRAALRAGVALVPEDRQQLGLVLPMSVSVNLTLAILQSLCRLGFPSARREQTLASRLVAELGVRTASLRAPAWALSGGNQQKLLLGKWLALSPKVLLLDEPTRGVDVRAKEEVHQLIRQLADQGMATLLISSDLPELLALSDRIIVMRAGRIVGELAGSEATQEKVMSLAIPAEDDPATGARVGGSAT